MLDITSFHLHWPQQRSSRRWRERVWVTVKQWPCLCVQHFWLRSVRSFVWRRWDWNIVNKTIFKSISIFASTDAGFNHFCLDFWLVFGHLSYANTDHLQVCEGNDKLIETKKYWFNLFMAMRLNCLHNTSMIIIWIWRVYERQKWEETEVFHK